MKPGVPWEPTECELAYREGRTSEVPEVPAVRARRRFFAKVEFRPDAARSRALPRVRHWRIQLSVSADMTPRRNIAAADSFLWWVPPTTQEVMLWE